jgi:hypothetical protein
MRTDGVLAADFGEVKFTLAPAEPEPAAPSKDDDEADAAAGNPLYDPATFGGKRVPGTQRGDRDK